MKQEFDQEPELYLLLEDYSARQFRPLATDVDLGASDEEPVFLLETADERSERWLKRHGDQLTIASADVPLRVLVEDFQPAQRFLDLTAGMPNVVLSNPGPEPDFEVHWDADRSRAQQVNQSRWGSFAVHLAVLGLVLLLPRTPLSQPPTEPTPGREYTQISLSAPSPEQMAQLTESARGDEGEAQRLAVAAAPEPVIAPEVRLQPIPAPMQPILPEPELEPSPIAEAEEPAPAPVPAAAQTPVPGEFQRGTELAVNPLEEEPPPAVRAPAQEKPKLQLENPRAYMPAPEGAVQIGELKLTRGRDSMIEAAQNQMSEHGSGRQAVGEGVGASAIGGYSAPSRGNIGSGVELLSDAEGVDFRPYLLQVLNSVRRNWFAVIPESARLGIESGRVVVQFAILPEGDVRKVVFATRSRSQPLDRASVAGISASIPFPPLPDEFKGDEIRVQLVFLYNTK